MIFPIGHESMTSRRWPIVTTIFIAINTVVLLLVQLTTPSFVRTAREAAVEAVVYFREHPYLDPCPLLAELALHEGTQPSAQLQTEAPSTEAAKNE